MSVSTALYRHFAEDGSLLYVGISLSWPARTKAHAKGSAWFNNVAKVTIERFPTRQEALEAERQAIKSERPKFNVVYNSPQREIVRRRKPAKASSPITRTRKWEKPKPVLDAHYHELSTGDIDSLDEIDADSQLALVWCDTHRRYEWHNLPRYMIGHTGTLVRRTGSGWTGRI